jgi:succinate dehydrogenase/fumarate reductase flavoprotein subunit
MNEEVAAQQTTYNQESGGKTAWETPPKPIPDSDIKETMSADVVVVGAATTGMVAALAAAQAGAKTIVLEKNTTGFKGPQYMAAIDSSVQKKLGITFDKKEIVEELCRYSAHLNNEAVVKLWIDRSGEFQDWFINIVEAAGLKVGLETDLKKGYYKSYAVGHYVMDPKKDYSDRVDFGARDYLPVLEEKARDLGVEIRYQATMVQLVKSSEGRISGVIVKTKNGDYIQINARKGVILCSGGYGRNVDMLRSLCPLALKTGMNYSVSTGECIRAAVWAGAALDPLQSSMEFDRAIMADGKRVGPPWEGSGGWTMGSHPYLRVNMRGERFVNEDLPYDFACNAAKLQPEGMWWEVWDSNWKEDMERFHTTICARIVPDPGAPPRLGVQKTEALMIKYTEKGLIKKADTIEDLARMMGVPLETFNATVTRYNQLYKKGDDEDFGKVSFRLSGLEKPPFYAIRLAPVLLCTTTGVLINTQLQVLDKDQKPIPGLYAAGNDSGSFFGLSYPQMFAGLALGKGATFAYLAARNAAAERV